MRPEKRKGKPKLLHSDRSCKVLFCLPLIILFTEYFARRLKELLRSKLIECGWRDELKAYSKGNSDIFCKYSHGLELVVKD